jgi:plasmid stabilization system protein ParE
VTRPYQVIFAPEASALAVAADVWWEANRPKAFGLFAAELGAAVERLERLPERGKEYRCSIQGMRRILLPRTRYHLYYVVEGECVRVHAVWHASRGQSPVR